MLPKAQAASPATSLASSRPPPPRLRLDVPLDLTITLAAGTTWLTLELAGSAIAPERCTWCDRNADGSNSLNVFDRAGRNALRWSNTRAADIASTVFSFGLAPAAGVGIGALIAKYDDRLDELPEDVLIVAEAAMIASDLNGVVKLLVARERPNVHARSPEQRAAQREPGDNLSFFSGHATLAFSLAVSAGTVASMRRHRLAPVMWASGLFFASIGGYLRIAADKHYLTDVLTGAAVGSAVGFAVPFFFHAPRRLPVAVAPLPIRGGAGLAVTGLF